MIWLIGNKGMLGTELRLLLEDRGFGFVGTDREVDITSLRDLESFANAQSGRIDWIVNCAAYTNVDKAEDETDLAKKINVDGPRNIGTLARGIGAKVLHISTDYVFDGNGNRPWREDDPTNPAGAYGLTKRDGERALLGENSSSYVVRTAWLYGKHGKNFVHTMLRLMAEKAEIGVVSDQRGTPTWARDLADALVGIITRPEVPFGIYHCTGGGETTWHAFALEIYRLGRELGLLGKDCAIKPLSTDEYPAKVRRPSYSVLDTGKIQRALQIEIPDWRKSLAAFLVSEARSDT